MKAERRHELRENDLAHALEVAREYVQENGTKLGLIVIVVVAVLTVITIATRSASAGRAQAWEQRNALTFQDVEEGRQSLATLHTLITEVTDEGFVLSGLIQEGTQALRLAREVELPPDRELNDRAAEAFEELLTRFPDNSLAVGTARLGLATVAENRFALTLDQTYKEQAREQLSAIVDDPKMSGLPYHRMAVDRLERLDKVFSLVRFDQPAEPTEMQPAPSDAPVEVKQLGPDGQTIDVPVMPKPEPSPGTP